MRVTIKPRIHAAIFFLLISLAGASYSQVPQIERDALSLYTIQLTGLTGRTIRVGLERLGLNVVGSGCAAML